MNNKFIHRWLMFICGFGILLLVAACGGEASTTTDTPEILPTGDTDIDQLTAAIRQAPNDAEGYAKRAEAFYDKSSYDQAIQDMTAALVLDSLNVDYHHLLADIYLDYFRSRLALQTMERAVAIDPNDLDSHLKLSEIQLFLKQHEASLRSIDQVLQRDPQNALAYFFMGKNFEELGDVNRAINAFQESSELNPEELDTWIKLGQLHASIDGELAEDFFDNAIELDADNTIALNAKAEYLWDQDSPRGALELYQEAIRRHPMDRRSCFNAGLVYLELDSLERAYQHFSMAIENSPRYASAYYHRGLTAEMLGNNPQAKQDYEHALRLLPDDTKAQEGLARVR